MKPRIFFFTILTIILVIGFFDPNGIRAAVANNAWSVAFANGYFQTSGTLPQVDPPPKSHVHAALFFARDALENGNDPLAIIYLEPAIKISHPLALDIYAEILFHKGQYKEAFSIWTELRNIGSLVEASFEISYIDRPDLVLLFNQSLYEILPEKYTNNIAINLKNEGDFESAITIIKKSLVQYPYSKNQSKWKEILSDIYITQGDFYQAQGEWSGAESAYQTALLEDPQDARAWIALGNLYYARDQDLEKTIAIFDNVTNIDPFSSMGYYTIAVEYWHLNQADLAIQAIENALQLMEPADIRYYLLAGQIYEESGSTQQALAAYQAALMVDAENITALGGVERLGGSQ